MPTALEESHVTKDFCRMDGVRRDSTDVCKITEIGKVDPTFTSHNIPTREQFEESRTSRDGGHGRDQSTLAAVVRDP